MNTITINNLSPIPFSSFNKVTRVDNGVLVRTANLTLPDATYLDELEALMAAGTAISSIAISMDGTTVYTKSGLEGTINNVSQHVYSGGMSVEVFMTL